MNKNQPIENVFQNLPKELLGVIAEQDAGANILLRRTSKEVKKIISDQKNREPVCDWKYVKKYLIEEVKKFYKSLPKSPKQDKSFNVRWKSISYDESGDKLGRALRNLDQLTNFDDIGFINIHFVPINSKEDKQMKIRDYLKKLDVIGNKIRSSLSQFPLLQYISHVGRTTNYKNDFLEKPISKIPYIIDKEIKFQVEPMTVENSWNLKERREICDLVYGIKKNPELDLSHPYVPTDKKTQVVKVERIIPPISEIIRYLKYKKIHRYLGVDPPFEMKIDLYLNDSFKFDNYAIYKISFFPEDYEKFSLVRNEEERLIPDKTYVDHNGKIIYKPNMNIPAYLDKGDEIFLNKFVKELLIKDSKYANYAIEFQTIIMPAIDKLPVDEAIEILKNWQFKN